MPRVARDRAIALRDDDYELGTYTRAISTTSPEAQRWFNRGLAWTFAFNHEAGIRCFEVVLELDPQCALAHWGIAFCNGVNYNNSSQFTQPGKFPSLNDASEHGRKALALLEHASAVEQMLVEAIVARCDIDAMPNSCQERRKLNSEFAANMAKVYEAYPDDPDIAALYGESLMNIYPWHLWVNGKVREPDALFAGTAVILDVLRSGLSKAPSHPGLLHMYIHAMEMAPAPQVCLPETNRLRNLAKDAGHLLHMPSHIDVLVGNYEDAIVANTRAIEADRKYISRNGAGNFYMLYCCHDCHMMVYSAMMAGDQRRATEAANELRTWLLKKEVEALMKHKMADMLESFVSMHMHVKVRFGQWKEILNEPLPTDEGLYCTTLAVTRYARVLAFAALCDVENATVELRAFKKAYDKVPETRTTFSMVCRDVLAVASAMADGEVSYRRGDHQLAFTQLREAVVLDDGMPYNEPWGWMQPARHALGALLLEQGHAEQAIKVYRTDLEIGHHPRNIWALHGLEECLQKSPSLAAHDGELKETQELLERARQCCDVSVTASCFCRLSVCGDKHMGVGREERKSAVKITDA
ncbi:uncharacterized protein LOC135828225 [Sycon ciliatum]|uniref:uncharacterized protein LOC135828225 n=1 Tax=Sycon ciliatum TaxID=27933 RepID=UPI0031F62E46